MLYNYNMAYINKEDQKRYAKEWYLRNKRLTISRSKISTAKLKKRNLEYIKNIKKNVPCVDCGNKYHFVAMDFDHTGTDKLHNVSRLANNAVSIAVLDAEIAKCELVCSNCHRIRTYIRRCGEMENTVASKATALVVWQFNSVHLYQNLADWRNGSRSSFRNCRPFGCLSSNLRSATICVCSPTAEAEGLNPSQWWFESI